MLLAELTIIEITDKLLLNEVYELRAKVWSELGVSLNDFPENKWMDEHENHSTHFAIVCDDKVIAASRMCIHDEWKLTKRPN